MSEYIFPVFVHSKNKDCLFRQFTVSHHKNFVKTLSNENSEATSYFLDKVISELSVAEIDIHNLSAFDKFYIMLCIRGYCIGTKITLSTQTADESKTKLNLQVDINDMINISNNYNIGHSIDITDNVIKLHATLPKKFQFADMFDVAADCISTITIKDKVINLHGIDHLNKRQILSTLPSTIFSKVLSFVQDQEKILKLTPIISFNTTKQLSFDSNLFISVISGTMLEVIKLIYNAPLSDFYTNEYVLMRKFKFNIDAIQSSTPQELNLYYDIINRDLEKEKQEMNKQSSRPLGRDTQSGAMGQDG